MVFTVINKIDEIIGRINVHPEYSAKVEREARNCLISDAAKHSLQLENEARAFSKETRHRTMSEDLRGLDDAWRYLAMQGINLASLSRLGDFIAPIDDEKGNAMYRMITEVDIGEVPPIAPEKVIYQMDDLMGWMQFTEVHPIVRAINSHIEIARIHPWRDGNGRGARLVQNFALEQKGYLPAIIYAEDFEVYKSLLRGTLKVRATGESSCEKPNSDEILFNHFVEGRILSSVRHLEDELLKRRHYDLKLNGVKDRSIVMRLRNKIANIGRKPQCDGVSVQIDDRSTKKNSYNLHVVGDVSTEEIKHALSSGSGRSDYSYNLNSVIS